MQVPCSWCRGRRHLGEIQCQFRQRCNTRHDRVRQCHWQRLSTVVHLLGYFRCSADVPFHEVAREPDRGCGVNVDDLAQLVDVATHRADALHDPDLGGNLGGEVADQGQGSQSRGLSAGTDDVAHERRVVELVLQAREIEAGAEELQLGLRGCGPDDLDADEFRDDLRDRFDGSGNIACFAFEEFKAAGGYRGIVCQWVFLGLFGGFSLGCLPLDSGAVRLLTLAAQQIAVMPTAWSMDPIFILRFGKSLSQTSGKQLFLSFGILAFVPTGPWPW